MNVFQYKCFVISNYLFKDTKKIELGKLVESILILIILAKNIHYIKPLKEFFFNEFNTLITYTTTIYTDYSQLEFLLISILFISIVSYIIYVIYRIFVYYFINKNFIEIAKKLKYSEFIDGRYEAQVLLLYRFGVKKLNNRLITMNLKNLNNLIKKYEDISFDNLKESIENDNQEYLSDEISKMGTDIIELYRCKNPKHSNALKPYLDDPALLRIYNGMSGGKKLFITSLFFLSSIYLSLKYFKLF